jgi:hypothetical protein
MGISLLKYPVYYTNYKRNNRIILHTNAARTSNPLCIRNQTNTTWLSDTSTEKNIVAPDKIWSYGSFLKPGATSVWRIVYPIHEIVIHIFTKAHIWFCLPFARYTLVFLFPRLVCGPLNSWATGSMTFIGPLMMYNNFSVTVHGELGTKAKSLRITSESSRSRITGGGVH